MAYRALIIAGSRDLDDGSEVDCGLGQDAVLSELGDVAAFVALAMVKEVGGE